VNKTKAKGLIEKIKEIERLVYEIEIELDFEHLLGYIYDYTSITIGELKERYHIK